MPDLPITLLARRQVCRNSVFAVYLDHIRDAAGKEVVDYLSVVPNHQTAAKVTGIGVLPIVEGKIGLIRAYRHPFGDYLWEIARGFVDAKETPIAAALRELREETGLSATEQSLKSLGALAPEPGVLDARILLFAAENCARSAGAVESDIGHQEIRYFTPAGLAGLIERGEVLDPCTLVAGLKYLSLFA